MKPSNNKYIITGNIDYNSTLVKPIVKLTNKSNISRLDLKIKADKSPLALYAVRLLSSGDKYPSHGQCCKPKRLTTQIQERILQNTCSL